MALIVSAASGNFSVGATWVGGVVPGAADEARASTGHTVTINANATCTEISNTGTGSFVLNAGVTLTANVTNKSTTTSVNCLTFNAASPNSATITGNCTGGTVTSSVAVANTSTGTLYITGNIQKGTGGTAQGLINSGTCIIPSGNITGGATGNGGSSAMNSGTLTVTGNVTGGGALSIWGLTNSGQLTVNGNVTGGSASNANAITITSNSSSVVINGNLVGGSAASAVDNTTTSPVSVIGNITATTTAGITASSTGAMTFSSGVYTASNSASAVTSTNAASVVRASGNFIYSSNGTVPIIAPKIILLTTPTAAKTRYALDGIGGFVDMFTADNTGLGPATNNVRSGVTYSGMTGSLAVPLPSQVAVGVPTDNTVGTAALTPADVRAALGLTSANLDTQLSVLSNLDAAVSSRLAPSGTLATVTTLTNSPNVPSAAAIADEVRVELATELARLDAPVSGATAPSAATVASQVRTELGTELARLDAAVSTRLATSGYTAPTTPPTAAANASAVRTELATELARVDAAVSTRLAGSAYTAPSNSDVTAIKAKTDLLETTRLAQCSTVATTGAQLAAALS